MENLAQQCPPTSWMHVGRVVVHGWRAALHHPGVHVGHHHPAGVKVHGQGRRAAHRARRVDRRAGLLGAGLLGVSWGGALRGLLLGLHLALGSLVVLVLPLLLLLQELLLGRKHTQEAADQSPAFITAITKVLGQKPYLTACPLCII